MKQWSLGVIGAVYVAAAVATNADTDEWSTKLGTGSFWRRNVPTQREMMDAKKYDLQKVRSSLSLPSFSTTRGLKNSVFEIDLSPVPPAIHHQPNGPPLPSPRIHPLLRPEILRVLRRVVVERRGGTAVRRRHRRGQRCCLRRVEDPEVQGGDV